ncbi:MAG: LamG-like jellyroll fold domain-containing protein [Cytophagaceae bacterium]
MRKLFLLPYFLLLIASAYAQVNDGLVASYSFNAGNANDEAFMQHATVNGATLTSDRFGNVNHAYNFNGSAAFITIPYTINTDLNSSSAITVSVWIKPNSLSGIQAILARWTGAGSSDQFLFALNNDKVFSAVRNVNNNGVSDNSSLQIGQWCHVVYTYSKLDNNRHQVYVNNVRTINTTFGGTYNVSTPVTELTLGAQSGFGTQIRHFNGIIDDLKIFNRVLTGVEIEQLYNAPAPYYPNQHNGLISRYKFNGNANDDASGYNNGLVSGATLSTDRFGNPNSAYQFNGTTSHIRIPHHSSISLNELNAFSISLWIKPSSISTGLKAIIAKWNGNADADQFGLFMDNNKNLTAVRNVNTNGASDVASYAADNWYHVVFAFNKSDQNRHIVYVNNIQTYNGTFAGNLTPVSATTDLSIGAQYSDHNGGAQDPKRHFAGAIDDIHIYNKVLTIAEVDSLYKIGNVVTDVQQPLFSNQSQIISFPNPAKDIIYFSEKVNAELLDVSGRASSSISGENQMNISKCKAGFYILIIKDSEGNIRERYSVVVE